MDIEGRHQAVVQLCRALMDSGACRNQNEMAELLGVNRSTLSSALNGSPRALTEAFVRKAQKAAAPYLGTATVSGNGNATAVNHSTVQPPAALEKALSALTEQQALTREAMAQNSRLINIIEGLTRK